MEKWKKIGRRLLYPGRVWTVLIPLAAFSALIAVFWYGKSESPVAYPIYAAAFYALVLIIAAIVPAVPGMVQRSRRRKAARVRDLKKSLNRSIIMDLIYAALHLLMGALNRSVWMITNGCYYGVFGLIHLVLVRCVVHQRRAVNEEEKVRIGWNGFQICGILMLMLNLSMAAKVFQMIWEGQSSHYPDLMIYAVAAYTFYRLTVAIIQVVQCWGKEEPIEGAARNFTLINAMMSLYSLQTALISTFGTDPDFQQLMNSITGGAVCFLVVLGALGMVIHGNKRKKELRI